MTVIARETVRGELWYSEIIEWQNRQLRVVLCGERSRKKENVKTLRIIDYDDDMDFEVEKVLRLNVKSECLLFNI